MEKWGSTIFDWEISLESCFFFRICQNYILNPGNVIWLWNWNGKKTSVYCLKLHILWTNNTSHTTKNPFSVKQKYCLFRNEMNDLNSSISTDKQFQHTKNTKTKKNQSSEKRFDNISSSTINSCQGMCQTDLWLRYPDCGSNLHFKLHSSSISLLYVLISVIWRKKKLRLTDSLIHWMKKLNFEQFGFHTAQNNNNIEYNYLLS